MDNIPKEKVSECPSCLESVPQEIAINGGKYTESGRTVIHHPRGICHYVSDNTCSFCAPSHLKEEPPTEKVFNNPDGGPCPHGCPWTHQREHWHYKSSVPPEKKEKEIQPKSEKKIEKLIPIDLSHTKEDSLARDIYGPMNKISAKINEIIDYLNE